MTVASETSRSGPYTGNNVTNVFDYEFRILDENHLRVIRTENGVETVLTIDTDYIVSDVGEPGGGQIALVTPPTASQTITILRDVPFTQETDLENQGPYFAETVEEGFDAGVMRDQQLAERLDRAVVIPASADPSSLNALVEDVLRLSVSADNIDAVANNAANINTVAGISADVATVAGVANDIPAVAALSDEIAAIGPVASDIPTVAANVDDITNFADVYQGPKASDPTLRNNGSALQAGDLYFNTAIDLMKVRTASGEWADASALSLNMTPNSFTGDGAGTDFVLSAGPGVAANLLVWVGGVRQVPGTDYTVSGATLTLLAAPGAGVAVDTLVVATVSDLNVPAAGTSVWPVSSRAELATLSPSSEAAVLTETGREGTFLWDASDLSARVSADSTQGTYVAPASAPSGASGAWRRIRPFGDLHRISEYGDDIAVAMAVCAATGGGTVEINKRGTIVPAAGLIIPPNVSLVGMGADTVIDFSSLSSGELIDGLYGAAWDGAGLAALPSFTSISAGDTTITFAAAHGLARGDVICIYDSANGSFLPKGAVGGGRDEYRRGQRVRVVDISGNTIYIDEPIVFSYASGSTTTIYKQSSVSGRIGGLKLSMEGSAVVSNRCIRITYGDRVKVDDLHAVGGSYGALELDQGFETEGSGVFHTDLQTTMPNSYPLSVINCTRSRFRNFSAGGKWNGVGTAGNNKVGAINNHDNVFEDFVAFGTVAAGIDMHGNSDRTFFRRGHVRNGVVLGGRDAICEDVHADEGVYNTVLQLSEVYGGRHEFIRGSLTCRSANSSSSTYKVHAYGGGAFRTAKQETFFKLHTRMDANAAAFWIGIMNDSPTYPVSHDIDINVGAAGALTDFVRMNNVNAVGPASHGKLRATGLPSVSVPFAVFENYTAKVYDYPRTKITRTIVTTADPTVVSPAGDSFNFYPVQPKTLVSAVSVAPGGQIPSPYFYARSQSSIHLAFTRAGGGAFSAGLSMTFDAEVFL